MGELRKRQTLSRRTGAEVAAAAGPRQGGQTEVGPWSEARARAPAGARSLLRPRTATSSRTLVKACSRECFVYEYESCVRVLKLMCQK